jgi:hypothetical protein
LGLKAPIWGLYSNIPDSEAEQLRSIQAVEKNNVQWALIDDWVINEEKENWKFDTGQKLFWGYLTSHFQMIPASIPRGCFLFHRNADSHHPIPMAVDPIR